MIHNINMEELKATI